MVWTVATLGNWVLFGGLDRYDIDLDSDFASALDLACLVFAHQCKPEFLRFSTLKLERILVILRHHFVVVFVIQRKRLLDKSGVLDDLPEVHGGLSQHLVALEEVSVVGLQVESVVFAWHADLEYQSVFEVGVAILTSEMRIRLLLLLSRIKEATEVCVDHSAIHRDVFAVEHADADLHVLNRFLADVPLLVFISSICRNDLAPQLEDSLAQGARWMVDLPVLNWFLLQTLPLHAEVPILHIKECFTDKLITEDGIIIPNLNLNWR